MSFRFHVDGLSLALEADPVSTTDVTDTGRCAEVMHGGHVMTEPHRLRHRIVIDKRKDIAGCDRDSGVSCFGNVVRVRADLFDVVGMTVRGDGRKPGVIRGDDDLKSGVAQLRQGRKTSREPCRTPLTDNDDTDRREAHGTRYFSSIPGAWARKCGFRNSDFP